MMGRWVKKSSDGTIKTESISYDDCKCLVNEMCDNPKSKLYRKFPDPIYYCERICPHFEPEVK